MHIEPVDHSPRQAFSRAVLRQRWEDLTFLHWAVDPALVAPLLPAGTRPDTLDGVSHVGLIGFRMVGLGLGRGPGVPYLGTFWETNVRLYSVDDTGRRAVVFRSLDASRLVPVLVARVTLGLPYLWSSMRLDRDGDLRTYRCRRRWPGPAGTTSRMVVRVGERIDEPTPLEHFVTARWGLHTRAYGRTLHLPNWHPRWPLHRAELLRLDDELVAAAGLPAPTGPPVSVLYSPGVAVAFGTPAVARPDGAGPPGSQ
ncbi:YqjF family protein [Micromonospora orduensis]|uniref:YqjF family protein n=1 Tax=Micromonospora orduensis TaxID=1420891 RepID=UPI0036430F6C